MDVILDANAYIQVLQMRGRAFLQTNQFTELLTYLRRTQSRLVIPDLTFNEVIERYRDRLSEVIKAARDAWETLQALGVMEHLDFPEPNLEKELDAIRELLRQPAKGVTAIIYEDYSGIDIREVVMRGIKRLRPASDKGEELRDVVLWLTVLRYAKQCGRRVAFVSNDKIFQSPEGTLHDSLKKDVERDGVNIGFYQLVRDFVKGNALDSRGLEQEFLARYVDLAEIGRLVAEQLVGGQFREGTVEEADVGQAKLTDAQEYRVAEDSFYVEAKYTGEATLRVRQRLLNLIAFTDPAPSVVESYVALPNPTASMAALLSASASPWDVPWAGSAWGSAKTPTTPPQASIREYFYKCTYHIRLSLRIVASKRESLEVDGLWVTEITPIAA